MRVLVCGSRKLPNPFAVSLAIDVRLAALPPGSTVMHGCARGVDQIAGEAARRHGHTVEEYPADWERYGKRAGVLRNLAMLERRPELVIAYWDGTSPGTRHTLEEANRRRIRVEVTLIALAAGPSSRP